MLRNRLIALSVTLGFLTVLVSCADRGTVDPRGGEVTFTINANLSGTMAATVVATVTAPDIPTMLVFNIPIVDGHANGSITVPAGSNRIISLHAYDTGGVETHNGSVTVTILSGSNPNLTIILTPLTGDLPITVTLGTVTVTVSPLTATLSVNGTRDLTATILDSQGQPVPLAVPTWATHHPGIATVIANVDGNGVVTATGVGTTLISAVFRGVTGTATITVTP